MRLKRLSRKWREAPQDVVFGAWMGLLLALFAVALLQRLLF
ncbi:MAG TPA: hypothetical protein VG273_22845 [Bryobacteraceae bacterium]|jgi:hypothetical protein|nr:hypothetical protein [Bryobacteraceae bacterium]